MAANGNEECKAKSYEPKLKLNSNNIFETSYWFDQSQFSFAATLAKALVTLPRENRRHEIRTVYCQMINFLRVSYVCFCNKILQKVFIILFLDNKIILIKSVAY